MWTEFEKFYEHDRIPVCVVSNHFWWFHILAHLLYPSLYVFLCMMLVFAFCWMDVLNLDSCFHFKLVGTRHVRTQSARAQPAHDRARAQFRSWPCPCPISLVTVPMLSLVRDRARVQSRPWSCLCLVPPVTVPSPCPVSPVPVPSLCSCSCPCPCPVHVRARACAQSMPSSCPVPVRAQFPPVPVPSPCPVPTRACAQSMPSPYPIPARARAQFPPMLVPSPCPARPFPSPVTNWQTKWINIYD